MITTVGTGRRGLVALTLAALTLALVAPFGAYADEDEIRTDPGEIAGYTVEASGAPVSILFFEPVFPIPVDPGEPHFELTASFTQTQLRSGPQARALASSAWPGAGMAGAPEQFSEDAVYPFVVDARYPAGPEEDRQATPWGAGMTAMARGLDVVARAESAESPDDEFAFFGGARSQSTSTVEDGVARAHIASAITDVRLLGGLIEIDEVSTSLEARATSQSGETTGQTTLAGLRIAGYGFVLDEDGLRPVMDGEPGDGSPPPPEEIAGADELREHLGIELELVPHEESVEAADARRRAGGVRITVDTNVLHGALTENIPVYDIVFDLSDAMPEFLPDEMRDVFLQLIPLLELSPEIVFVFGRGAVRAAGSEGIDLDLDLDFDPVEEGVAPPPSEGGGFDAPTMTSDPFEPAEDDAAPVVAEPSGPGPEVHTLAAEMPDLFGGIPPAVAALALLAAALGGLGLVNLSGAAFGAAAGGAACGHPRGVPDLRQGGS